jgi:hypothetical protein
MNFRQRKPIKPHQKVHDSSSSLGCSIRIFYTKESIYLKLLFGPPVVKSVASIVSAFDSTIVIGLTFVI